ncbi:MAG: GAF and ANTAR domain-containing protein [Nitriliruptoraceae bacterium]|nr:GAF and ANTAR domain-containing protein [Nitriliruptoraceae bacterium]
MSPARTAVADPERLLIATFVAAADTLVEDFDVVDFLSTLAERVVELGFASEVGILLADEAGDLQVLAASHERTHLLELFQVQREQGPCQDCFTSGTTVSVHDLEQERERWPQFTPRALETGFLAVHAVPLRLRGTVLGAMNLFHEQPGGLDEDAGRAIQALADVATIGLLQQREVHRAHMVQAQLQHALNSRIGIEQAKGVLAERAGISVDDAFDRMRRFARGRNRKMADVAGDVVAGRLGTDDLPRRRR